jgi:hypothetical protein
MYQPHPVFKNPVDVNEPVWRYMDLSKFIAILASRSLYFARADLLGDPFEGSYTMQSLEILDTQHRVYGVTEMLSEGARRLREQRRKEHVISCWHLNRHESAAMWSLYLKSSEGLAIQSTYANLRDCFEFEHPVYLGAVDYIDYKTEAFETGNAFVPFVTKRKSFEHEREVRAIVSCSSINPDQSGRPLTTGGASIKVNLEKLVNAVYVAPTAPTWFLEVVHQTIKQFGYAFEVRQSDLTLDPLF